MGECSFLCNENIVANSGLVLLFHHFKEGSFDEIVLRGPVQNKVVLSLLEVPFTFGLEIIRLDNVGSIVKLNWLDKTFFT